MYFGSVFWICVVLIVFIAIWLSVVRVKERQKTIRLAIEKGYEINSELIEFIDRHIPTKSDGYFSGGFICLMAGSGIVILGFFIKKVEVTAFYPMIGGGILTGLVGLGLIFFGYMLTRKKNKE